MMIISSLGQLCSLLGNSHQVFGLGVGYSCIRPPTFLPRGTSSFVAMFCLMLASGLEDGLLNTAVWIDFASRHSVLDLGQKLAVIIGGRAGLYIMCQNTYICYRFKKCREL